MRRLLIISMVFLSISIELRAAEVDPSSGFDTPLDTNLWTIKRSNVNEPVFDSGNNITLSVDSGTLNYFADGAGGAALQSNFYYIGDFDVTLDVYSVSNANSNARFCGLRFFNYGTESRAYSSDQGGDYAVNWGVAGSCYGWFLGEPGWIYPSNISNYNSSFSVYRNEWFQLRVQRIGDDIMTSYKLLADDDWILQNVYSDFGSQSVYLELHMDGSSDFYTNYIYYADNFTSQGYADTDPLAIPVEPVAIPEPVTMISLLAAIAAIKFRNLIRK